MGSVCQLIVRLHGCCSCLLVYHTRYDAPVVSNVHPNHAVTAGGVLLTVTGKNFGFSDVLLAVGPNAAPTVLGKNDTHIVAICPAGTGGNLSVTVSTLHQVSVVSRPVSSLPLLVAGRCFQQSRGGGGGGSGLMVCGCVLW